MNFPPDFRNRNLDLLGEDYLLLEKALQEEPPVSIRVNPKKLTAMPILKDRVEWCDSGFYLPERPSFTFDPLFHAGWYYVQEASSMFLEQVVRQHIQKPVVCLDLCAAPGGKSTHLLTVLPEKSLLVSNEIIRSRASILKENVIKWGSPYNIVTNSDPKSIGKLTHTFDVIVADLPCSGEGMFRKDLNSRSEWSVKNVELCASRQRQIVQDVWECLKPGGYLIYSTCTFNREENEDNIEYILKTFDAEAVSISTSDNWLIANSLNDQVPAFRFYPHLTRGEGFFLACIRKKESPLRPHRSKKNYHRPNPSPSPVKEWLVSSFECEISMVNSRIQAFPLEYTEIHELISSTLHKIYAGVEVGEVKGKDIVPSHMLALSQSLRQDAFPTIELNWDDAIRFLQKEAFSISQSHPKGYLSVRFQGASLGFLKNIGNRMNNLYPMEWRIRSLRTPDSCPGVIQYDS